MSNDLTRTLVSGGLGVVYVAPVDHSDRASVRAAERANREIRREQRQAEIDARQADPFYRSDVAEAFASVQADHSDVLTEKRRARIRDAIRRDAKAGVSPTSRRPAHELLPYFSRDELDELEEIAEEAAANPRRLPIGLRRRAEKEKA